MPVQLFISHSERDEKFVRPLTNWMQSGLGLTDDQIRCTSVSNMDVGSIPAQALREDLTSAKAIIGLLTANSLRSHWAQLEMGAAWLQERLHPIRGPGISVSDLPSPLSDFTTVGFCENAAMKRLMHQLAEIIGTEVDFEVEQNFDRISQEAQETLVADMVCWFSLPPVLSAWRIDKVRYEYELLSLCTELELSDNELRSCTTSMGVLTRDPDQLPMWAKNLWTVSKNAVNFMLSRPTKDSEDFLDVPRGVLNDRLIADMKRALHSKDNRASQMRKWFEDAKKWILDNPPSELRTHSPPGHH